jgi:beta-glucosidase
MAAYNSVNGTTMTEHPMLREVLKDEWGFDGVVMSDWFAARSTEPAANAGLDLVMPGPGGPWGDKLVAAVRAGRVAEATVDDKLLRLLRLAARVGALDGVEPAAPTAEPWPEAAVAAELRATAAAGFVLARNAEVGGAPALPLDRSALGRVAVVGPNAEAARTLGGGSATVFPPYTVSPLQGLRTALGPGVQVDHGRGGRSTDRLPVAPAALLRHPETGQPGLEVRFLAADGGLLGREDHAGAAFTWLGSVVPGLPVADVAAVEVHTRVRAPEAGTYLVGVSGLGRVRLTVAGQVAYEGRIELPPGADPVEGIMRPPQRSTRVELQAGEEAPVELRYQPAPGEGFGDAEIAIVTFQLNVARQTSDDDELDQAAALAREADVAVVVVGTTEEVESEGFDRDSLALPGGQDELVRRVAAVNPRTIVVVNAGAPVLLPWLPEVPAVLLCWFPGQEFGHALADVLLGAVEPGGRLPVTWPAAELGIIPSTRPVNGTLVYDEALHVGHRAYDRAGVEPAFPFGHGLGYTSWSWEGIEAPSRIAAGDDLTVRVRLRNTGRRAGKQVVQVYLSRPTSSIDRPGMWLAGHEVVRAAAGQRVTAQVRVAPRAFQHWSVSDHAWRAEPGTFRVAAGPSVMDRPLACDVEATQEPRRASRRTLPKGSRRLRRRRPVGGGGRRSRRGPGRRRRAAAAAPAASGSRPWCRRPAGRARRGRPPPGWRRGRRRATRRTAPGGRRSGGSGWGHALPRLACPVG